MNALSTLAWRVSPRTADVGDPTASRTVYLVVAGLVVVGVALVVVAVWLIRQTRVDPELLAPLEEMETRRWQRTDPVGRRRLLDAARPDGAVPAVPTPGAPDLDDEFGTATRDLDELLAVADESPFDTPPVAGSAVVGPAGDEAPAGGAGPDSVNAVGSKADPLLRPPAAEDRSAVDG